MVKSRYLLFKQYHVTISQSQVLSLLRWLAKARLLLTIKEEKEEWHTNTKFRCQLTPSALMTFPQIYILYLLQNLIVITGSTCRLAIVPHTYRIILLRLCFFNTEIKLHIVGGGGGNWWQQQWQIYYMCMDTEYCTYSIISSFKWNMLSAINTIQSHIKASLAVSPSIF